MFLSKSHEGVIVDGKLVLRCLSSVFDYMETSGDTHDRFPFVFRIEVLGMKYWCAVSAGGRIYFRRSPITVKCLCSLSAADYKKLLKLEKKK